MTNETEFDSIVITGTEKRPAGGVWASGFVDEFIFQSLVFDGSISPQHEVAPESRLAKLWIRRLGESIPAYEWDRGPSTPTDDARVLALVDFLAAGLAEAVSEID